MRNASASVTHSNASAFGSSLPRTRSHSQRSLGSSEPPSTCQRVQVSQSMTIYRLSTTFHPEALRSHARPEVACNGCVQYMSRYLNLCSDMSKENDVMFLAQARNTFKLKEKLQMDKRVTPSSAAKYNKVMRERVRLRTQRLVNFWMINICVVDLRQKPSRETPWRT